MENILDIEKDAKALKNAGIVFRTLRESFRETHEVVVVLSSSVLEDLEHVFVQSVGGVEFDTTYDHEYCTFQTHYLCPVGTTVSMKLFIDAECERRRKEIDAIDGVDDDDESEY